MLKNLRNNDAGIIFVTVLIIIIIAMTLAISVIGLNVSQVKSSEDELRYIQAKILADGALARTYVNQLSNSPGNTFTYTEPLGNTTFTITSNIAAGGNPFGSESSPTIIDVSF